MRLTLSLGDGELKCREGSLFIHVQTEQWVQRKFGPFRLPGRWKYDPSLAYAIIELEIDVDEDSGGDGEPAPRLEIEIPPKCWELPTIKALSGSRWENGGGATIAGWYGNDAPEIEESAISFGMWCDDHRLAVDWMGTYRWRLGDPAETFRLIGPVRFAGLHLSVKSQADVAKFLAAALPGFGLEGLELLEIATTDFGPEFADKSRRHWERHHWATKRDA